MLAMDNIRALVENELNIIENYLYDCIKSDKYIFSDLNSFVLNKSKRIRSLLCLLYLKAHNVKITEDITFLTVSGELIHNASLLHDDVIDSADYRRGSETISHKYDSKIAVLSGDYLLSLAVEQLMKLHNVDILDNFIYATKKMSFAEIMQYSNRSFDVSINNYLEIIEGKTASLFSAILKCSAILSGIDINIADSFGKYFGIAFQINNDMLPDSATNDKVNGVKTALDILGIEKTLALKDNYKEEMRNCIVDIPDNVYKEGIEDLIELL